GPSRRRRARKATRNWEFTGGTELMSRTRQEARSLLALDAARTGADGVLMAMESLKVWKQRCAGSHEQDQIVEAMYLGTGITAFKTTGSASPSISVLPLTDRSDRTIPVDELSGGSIRG